MKQLDYAVLKELLPKPGDVEGDASWRGWLKAKELQGTDTITEFDWDVMLVRIIQELAEEPSTG